MTTKTITLKSITGNVINITYDCDKVYTIENLKRDLCIKLNEIYEQLDIKIVYNGSILPNDLNLTNDDYSDKSMVFLKKRINLNNTKKINIQHRTVNNLSNIDTKLIARLLTNSISRLLLNNSELMKKVLVTIPQLNNLITDGNSIETIINSPTMNEITNELRILTQNDELLPLDIQIRTENNDQTNYQDNIQNLRRILNSLSARSNEDQQDGDSDDDEYQDDNQQDDESDEDQDENHYDQNMMVGQNLLNTFNQVPNITSYLSSKFTEEEKKQISSIVDMGFNTVDVLQMYDACDKNVELTIQNLMNSLN